MFQPNQLLGHLCALPHRGAATAHERAAADLLAETLTSLGGNVARELFKTPKTYVTVVYWLIGGLLAGLFLSRFATLPVVQWLGLALTWVAIINAWLYFNWRYSPVIHLPVQHRAENVVGRWGPADAPRRLILMAHYDTAPVSALYGPKQQSGFRNSLIFSLLLMLGAGALTTYYVLNPALNVAGNVLHYVWIALVVYFVLQAITGTVGYWTHGYTNGASDNATGVVAAIATADQLRATLPPDVAMDVVLTSAEEAGMLGAYHYVAQHRKEWPKDVAVINFDTLGAGKLTVIEQTGTVETIRYDNAMTQAARAFIQQPDWHGRAQMGRWHTADFDSVWFVRRGINTLALCALDEHSRMSNIHRPDDQLAAVDVAPMHAAVALAVAVMKKTYAVGAATSR